MPALLKALSRYSVRQPTLHNEARMSLDTIKRYSLNCFLLNLPIIVWNIVLTRKLPQDFQAEIFWKDIPAFLTYGENISRALVFILTLLMPLNISTLTQKRGLSLFVGGTLEQQLWRLATSIWSLTRSIKVFGNFMIIFQF